MPLQDPVEWVQAVSGSIEIRRLDGHVQRCEQDSEPLRMRGLDSRLRSGFGKKLESFVPVTPNHPYSV